MDASSFCLMCANDGTDQSYADNNEIVVTITDNGANDLLTLTAGARLRGRLQVRDGLAERELRRRHANVQRKWDQEQVGAQVEPLREDANRRARGSQWRRQLGSRRLHSELHGEYVHQGQSRKLDRRRPIPGYELPLLSQTGLRYVVHEATTS